MLINIIVFSAEVIQLQDEGRKETEAKVLPSIDLFL